jgi:hypothetical protein
MYDKNNPITKSMRDEFRKRLLKDFDVEDRGDLEHFIGFKVLRDRKNGKLKLTQTASLMKLLTEAGMLTTEKKMTACPPDCKPSVKNDPDPNTPEGKTELEEVSRLPYANRVGSLLWIARTYRPDISWAVGMMTRWMAKPNRSMWRMTSYLLKFLSSTKNRGLIYSRTDGPLTLTGVCDANHLCDYGDGKENRKNTLGWAFMLGGASISVRSRKAQRASSSSAESETQSLWDATREAVWLRRLCKELGIEQVDPTMIECDSQVAIRLTEEDCESDRTKHWDGEYQIIRSEVNDRESVKIKFVPTADCVGDTLTKPLGRRAFDQHSAALMGNEWLFEDEEILP